MRTIWGKSSKSENRIYYTRLTSTLSQIDIFFKKYLFGTYLLEFIELAKRKQFGHPFCPKFVSERQSACKLIKTLSSHVISNYCIQSRDVILDFQYFKVYERYYKTFNLKSNIEIQRY